MIRVAAYCRVSTDKEDQANSFETQQHFFREWIGRKPEWVLQGIYADESMPMRDFPEPAPKSVPSSTG